MTSTARPASAKRRTSTTTSSAIRLSSTSARRSRFPTSNSRRCIKLHSHCEPEKARTRATSMSPSFSFGSAVGLGTRSRQTAGMARAKARSARTQAEHAASSALPLSEQINPSTGDLDSLPTHELLHRINDEDRRVAWAVEREIDVIATAVDAITERLRAGGRLHYFGAGTSGRIAALDAAEIPPTFSEPGTVVAHIAGGAQALARAVEGAEDDAAAGAREVRRARIGKRDAVVGLSASGSAPYVLGAVQAALKAQALTIGLSASPDTPLTRMVHVPIVLQTGPEVIAGSTRMKAGS